MEQVARGDRHSETLRALGNRMIRLDLKLNEQQRKRVNELAGKPLALIAGELIHATNEEPLIEAAELLYRNKLSVVADMLVTRKYIFLRCAEKFNKGNLKMSNLDEKRVA